MAKLLRTADGEPYFDDEESSLYGSDSDDDVEQQTMLAREMLGHTDEITALTISGGVAYSTSFDCSCKAFEMSTREVLMHYYGHAKPVTCLTVCKTGGERILYTGSQDKTARAWHIDTGYCTHIFRGHSDFIIGIQMHEDVLYTGSRDCTARSWNLLTGETLKCFGEDGTGHTATIHCMQVRPHAAPPLVRTGARQRAEGVSVWAKRWPACAGRCAAEDRPKTTNR